MADSEDAWLGRDPLPADPFPLLASWLDEAFADGRQPSPHAIALATCAADGMPEVRLVLCQAVEPEAGALVFFTHRESPKGRALAALPFASACFSFTHFGRQARISGPVEFTSDAESDAYFATRPVESQVGAWASHQSEPIGSRAELMANVQAVADRFGVAPRGAEPSDRVRRPPAWGGYRLRAERIELWHSRPGRVHDRAEWSRRLAPKPSPWTPQRLQP
ncbi:MAG: pyridoxamine 5'-phosphate oxidase [Deltaproteobacteria bacterium]|nr:pyridoxamine 5'-phosphate oxidase [Deltaproteobacteria bacterium]